MRWCLGGQALQQQLQIVVDDLATLQIEPRHPLGYGAQQLIGDGLHLLGHIVDQIVLAKDLHHIACADVGQIGQIDHAHIHADTAPDRRQAVPGEHLPLIGVEAEQSVGIADGHHTDDRW